VGQQNRVRVKRECDETPLCFSSLSLSYSLSIGKSFYTSIQLFLEIRYFTHLFNKWKEYESAPFLFDNTWRERLSPLKNDIREAIGKQSESEVPKSRDKMRERWNSTLFFFALALLLALKMKLHSVFLRARSLTRSYLEIIVDLHSTLFKNGIFHSFVHK
jgi:hypothetical protein